MIKYLQFICCFILATTGLAQSTEFLVEEGWELKKEKHEIKVYSKSLEDYKVKAFKAVGLIEADIVHVYNAILDIENYPEWYPDCEKGKLLEEKNQEQVRQTVYDLPWPFESRDSVSKLVSRKEDGSIWMEVINAAEYLPEDENYVRIPRTEGYWLLVPSEEGTIVTYSAAGEAPGVPSWIVNLFILDGPLDALNNLRQVVTQDKYKSAPDWLK